MVVYAICVLLAFAVSLNALNTRNEIFAAAIPRQGVKNVNDIPVQEFLGAGYFINYFTFAGSTTCGTSLTQFTGMESMALGVCYQSSVTLTSYYFEVELDPASNPGIVFIYTYSFANSNCQGKSKPLTYYTFPIVCTTSSSSSSNGGVGSFIYSITTEIPSVFPFNGGLLQ